MTTIGRWSEGIDRRGWELSPGRQTRISVNPVAKALCINSWYAQDVSFEGITNCAGVSSFHLLRAFDHATGR